MSVLDRAVSARRKNGSETSIEAAMVRATVSKRHFIRVALIREAILNPPLNKNTDSGWLNCSALGRLLSLIIPVSKAEFSSDSPVVVDYAG